MGVISSLSLSFVVLSSLFICVVLGRLCLFCSEFVLALGLGLGDTIAAVGGETDLRLDNIVP